MLRLYIGLYNQFVNLIPIRTFQIKSILSIRLIWNAKQFNSIRASSEDSKDLLAPLAILKSYRQILLSLNIKNGQRLFQDIFDGNLFLNFYRWELNLFSDKYNIAL